MTKIIVHTFQLLAIMLLLSPQVLAGDLNKQAPERLQQYIRIDTTNPPGNESRGVKFFAGIFEEAGISYDSLESAPGRGNIWSRLKGGNKPALVLLHHIDVVPADRRYWDSDPLAAEIRDGYIYGRGAQDTKGLGIVQLQAFLALAKSGKRLNRDVIYLATADEEAGGFFGAGYLAENRPKLFRKVGFLINEGGVGLLYDGVPAYMIEVTQKVPLWLRLEATDIPGHGSAPRITTSVNRILRAGNRIATNQFPARVVDAVDASFKAKAIFEEGSRRESYMDLKTALSDPMFVTNLQIEDPYSAALLRNTCSITTLEGSNKINVVPPVAALELDCRLLPDQSPDEFMKELAVIVNDPAIKIKKIMGFSPAVSRSDTELFRALGKVLQLHFENAVTIPSVSTGFTDSHFFRDMGIVAYGFSPFLLKQEDMGRVHGNNERISVENMIRGSKMMTDFLLEFAVAP